MGVDYSTVTEVPGNRASHEQLSRMFHRYHFASNFCEKKDVLEVACGAGQGLGYLARKARKVVGGDCTEKLVHAAREHYKKRIDIYLLDAHHLPFEDKRFDVVILYEAFYYLKEPEKFIKEAHRVLRDNGVLIICTVNKDWPDFNPSPFSTKYFSVPELTMLLNKKFFGVELYGAFPANTIFIKDKLISLIKRVAITLHLIPKTMKGKELFKRMFFGKLSPLPYEISGGIFEYTPPLPVALDSPNHDFKVLYAVAKRN
jgi:SAM-dependent methyltransferase